MESSSLSQQGQKEEEERGLTEEELLQGAGQRLKEKERQQKHQQGEDVEAQFFVLSRDKSFALQCTSREERQEWFTDISAACR